MSYGISLVDITIPDMSISVIIHSYECVRMNSLVLVCAHTKPRPNKYNHGYHSLAQVGQQKIYYHQKMV